MTSEPPQTRSGRPKAFSSAHESTWQSTLAWREGLREILLRWNGLLSLVWFIVAALAAVSIVFTLAAAVRLIGVPVPGGDALFGESPLKFIFAAAIYVAVVAAGSHHLLTGLGLLAREQAVLATTSEKVDTFRGESNIGRAVVFGASNPFEVTGFNRIQDAPQTATFKLVTVIHADAARDRFDPVNLLVDSVGDQVLGGSQGIRDSQQLGVRLGVNRRRTLGLTQIR